MSLASGRPTGFTERTLRDARPTLVRSIEGTIAAESTTLSLANYPASLAVDFWGFRTVLLAVEFGTYDPGDDVTLEALFLDAQSGAEFPWLVLASDAGRTIAMAPGTLVEVPVWGRKAAFRVHAQTGDPEDLQVIAYPGQLHT